MRRREFITLLGGAVATPSVLWPLAARAQQPDSMRRIGVLSGPADDAEGRFRVSSIEQEIRRLGWTEGHNVRIERRWGNDDAERIRAYAAELVAMAPDAILAIGTPALLALRDATRSIPIVFVNVGDLTGLGVVDNLARPGGNITGFTSFERTMVGKWLQLLKEIAPRTARVFVILNPENPTSRGALHIAQALGPSIGLKVTAAGVHDAAEIERAVEELSREPDAALIVLPDPTTIVHRERIAALAALHRLPAVYPFRFFVTGGGLMSYGQNPIAMYRGAASYVDRVLRGEKPGELPIQLPTKFELIVNLKAAKALGLTIPESFLLRADEVIE